MLLLVPSEQEAMLKGLAAAKVPVKTIKMNPSKQQPITGALQALLSKDSALKVSQQSAAPYSGCSSRGADADWLTDSP